MPSRSAARVSHDRLPSPRLGTALAALAAALLAGPGAAGAQTAPTAPAGAPDSAPPFARARRLAAGDLAKKREGAFVTGLPDLSSDPVAGFGYGARANVFWNGRRDDPLFAYTPYRARGRIGAYNTTAEQRELVLGLDLPFVGGTRWRIKIDAVAGSTPAKLYFGLTEATLGDLRLPSGGGTTFATYADYDRARKTLRPGAAGEAARVTDALSNRFGEEELMLNLKADRALGAGRWRVLGGYEIQRLRYRTFAGRAADAVDPATGAETSAPNGVSLLARDAAAGAVTGLQGGRVSILQQALLYDTRDFEPDPTRGLYVEVGNELSAPAIGSQFTFDKLFVQAKAFRRLPVGPRTVLAGRVGAGNIFGRNAPFFEFQDQWSPDGSVNALGGSHSLRGYRANRFLGRSLWMANAEVRARLAEVVVAKQRFGLGVAPFVDAGTVRDRWQALNLGRVRWSYGAGARIAWNQSTLISLDVGRSREDRLLFFGLGQAF
jgi:outer membrane protein assembly factor BamA